MIPAIGETITTARARALAVELGLHDVVAWIDAEPDAFESWTFDGISGLPDWVAARLTRIEETKLTRLGLEHDLPYAYGRRGDELARLRKDVDLLFDLAHDDAIDPTAADAFYNAVRIGGGEWTPFTWRWGFARRAGDAGG